MDFIRNIYRVWKRETYLTFTDLGVLIFFVLLPLGYPVIYTLIYNPELVTDIPVVAVDNSRTAESRELIRAIDATQGIHIIGCAANLNEAREAWNEKDCYAIVEVPSDYAAQLGRGGQATVSWYQDMSLLLRYRQSLFALTGVQMDEVEHITAERISSAGGILSTVVSGLPVNSQANILGDPTQGFASFIMPGVVVLILQQSMLLGITMLAGTSRDRRRRSPLGIDPESVRGVGAAATVLGKSLCYMMIYMPMAYFDLSIIPQIFSLPHVGEFWQYMPFIFVMLLATTFLGQTIQVFVRERETSFLVVVFTSVIVLFLSGLTWPRYAFNSFWLMVSNLVPATWGMEGFIRINGNAARIWDVGGYYWASWAVTALYFVTALIINRYLSPQTKERTANLPV